MATWLLKRSAQRRPSSPAQCWNMIRYLGTYCPVVDYFLHLHEGKKKIFVACLINAYDFKSRERSSKTLTVLVAMKTSFFGLYYFIMDFRDEKLYLPVWYSSLLKKYLMLMFLVFLISLLKSLHNVKLTRQCGDSCLSCKVFFSDDETLLCQSECLCDVCTLSIFSYNGVWARRTGREPGPIRRRQAAGLWAGVH